MLVTSDLVCSKEDKGVVKNVVWEKYVYDESLLSEHSDFRY